MQHTILAPLDWGIAYNVLIIFVRSLVFGLQDAPYVINKGGTTMYTMIIDTVMLSPCRDMKIVLKMTTLYLTKLFLVLDSIKPCICLLLY